MHNFQDLKDVCAPSPAPSNYVDKNLTVYKQNFQLYFEMELEKYRTTVPRYF